MSEKPLITKDNITLAFKVLKQLTVGLIAGSAMFIGLWKGVTEPQLKEMIEENNIKRDSIYNATSGSFRSDLGVLLKVPKELVSLTIYAHIDSTRRFMVEAGKYEDFLERFSTIKLLSPYLDINGDEWQPMLDGRDYRVNYDNGQRWIVYHGHRVDL